MDTLLQLHLMRPQWLWAALPALILFALLWRQRRRTGSWHSVIAPDLLRHLISDDAVSRGANFLPLVLLGWLLAVFAASGPSWHKIPQPVHQKQDALVVLLDLSYSMKSADLVPSRVDRARQKLLDLLQLRREGQTGLIAYAGDAHIVTPLTDDTLTIANLLPALDPDMMPLPGSEPVSAVSQALDLLRSAGIQRGNILLVTDGVSERDSKGIEQVMAGSDSILNIMGVGTATGAPIPLPSGGFAKDESGTIVMPGLDEQSLRALANATGGSYRRMQVGDQDIAALLANNPLLASDETLALDRTADTWEDQGYWFVLALLPLVLALFRRGWLLSLLPVLLLAHPDPASAQSWDDLWLTPDQQGQRALQRGDAEAAASLFENPGWAGTAAFQQGDFEAAAEYFNERESADSAYNRGNALARAGQLDAAIDAYKKSLQLQPDQQDAQNNLDLLKKLKEQQEQQQNQEQQQDQQQDQEQQQNQDQQQDQEQQQSQDQQQDQEQQQNQDQQQDQEQQQNQDQQQDQEQQQNQDQQQNAEQQDSEQEQEPEAQPAKAQQTDATDSEQPPLSPEEAERDQAMEQWLRRVPDDPSGLLRQKFRYESQQRQQQGVVNKDETFW